MDDVTVSQENEKIVISGISGKFPDSSNVEEFKRNLFDGVDLVTEDDRRWPTGMHGLPTRNGKLKDLTRFDATFFGVHPKQADVMDPQLRMLLEITHEALIDAGINPTEFNGSNTGVFIGMGANESLDLWRQVVDKINGYELLGCTKNMFANRISFSFNLKGPSYVIDTACSSSMMAIHQAVSSIWSGECDAAIIGGANLLLKPEGSISFNRLNMLSPDGCCKVFDSARNGFVRSEAAAIIILQKANVAKRVYATVLGTKMNTDGNKKEGITFPSGEMQGKLIREVYLEAGLDPAEVTYVEAHGTGTAIGDPQEGNAIVDNFCTANRKSPLLVGSVKSNMGHSEGASGLCSIAKILIAMESGAIPANLHFKHPNEDIPGLIDGRLKVVSENEPWNGGIIGVNSFGFGGVNVHVILSSNPNSKTTQVSGRTPRLITVSGRTEEAVNYFLDKINECDYDAEMYALIDGIHCTNIKKHGYRGFKLRGENINEVAEVINNRPIWFVFCGIGSQWPGMGRKLMEFEPIRNSIKRLAVVLKPYAIDLEELLVNGDQTTFENVRNAIISIAAIQIALVDVLRSLNVEPDGILGHSFGELGCAYADGTLTAEQTILVAYARGTAILETNLLEGAMASVGLTWEESQKRCPPDVYPACHNTKHNVTISGEPKSLDKFIEQLTKENIFTRKVKSTGIAFHSRYITDAAPHMLKSLESIIPRPKRRSSKWISSSVLESDWNTETAQYSSAAYHVNNLLSPVYFYEATKHIPENAILIEFGPHASLLPLLKRSLSKTVTSIGLLKRDHPDNVNYLLSNIGRIYNAGGQPKVSVLYPPVAFPVTRGTPKLCDMIKWDHSKEWSVADFSGKHSQSGKLVVDVNLSKEEFQYLAGHVVDGRIVFPAAGYLTLVWKTFARLKNTDYEQLAIVLKDVKFLRATIMPKHGSVKFFVNILEGSGEFEIYESGSVVVTGKIYAPEVIEKEFLKLHALDIPRDQNALSLSKEDIYREFHLRGYEYDGMFRGIEKSDNYGFEGVLRWENNWISFIDSALQFSLLSGTSRALYLPTGIHKLIINPKTHVGVGTEVPVQMFRDVMVIKAGGVELRQMRASLALRQEHRQPSPILEKYQFVPLENTSVLEKDVEKSTYNALAVVSQLVCENSCGALKIKVVEVADEDHELILPTLQVIFKSEPMHQIEGVIVTSVPINETLLEDNGIKVLQKDITSGAFVKNAHMVILVEVLQNSQGKLLENAISSLKPGGFILFEEPISRLETDLLTAHSLIVIYQQVSARKLYLLARKSEDIPQKPIVVTITESNFDWVEPLKQALKISESNGTRVYLLCQGENLTGLLGIMHCVRKEPGCHNVRSIFVQNDNVEPFATTSNYYVKQLKKGLVQNVLKNGIWGTYRYLRLDQTSGQAQVEHAYINILRRGDLSTLKWIEGSLKFYKETQTDAELCTVYYASLNFHDIMVATGKLPVEALGSEAAGHGCFVGMEFAGRDSRGCRVMGMLKNRCMATTVLADAVFHWEVPKRWSLEEAATIPVVYITCYYSLIMRGKMQTGERILVHSGTGGVGLAAISIALHMGCKVFTTVGSPAKREFLKTRFPQLTDECIGNSRDASFEHMILRQTKGRGVDLVLNSLAGDLLEASVRCLAIGGRFLEIGKFDLSNNSALGMSMFLKNTSFHGILIDNLLVSNCTEKHEIHRLVTEGIENGAVRPLPTTLYAKNEVESAFRFMASGKHVGKVILKIRTEENRGTVLPVFKTVNAISKSYMDPEKVYVLVGGLGGFGLELTNWLISRGAKKIVLSSRSGVKSGYQCLCVRRWRSENVIVDISTADVTTERGARCLLEEAKKLGCIGGIFNLAAVLKDAMMVNQTAENFKTVCKPKIDATKHLDSASRHLAPSLDHFVVFSSLTSGRGNSEQANYGYANSAMERICEVRHAIGLPGIAIQWGPIGDVGLVVEMFKGTTEICGLLHQNICSCLSVMDIFLQQHHPVVSSLVLAAKREDGDPNQVKLSDSVANILGISNIKTIAPESSLADLGMDSLMGTEIKQTLERNYDVVLNSQEIGALTFSTLFKVEAGTKQANTQDNFGKEAVLQFAKRLMPMTTVLKMHSKENSKNKTPVFILTTIEGTVSILQPMVHKIQAPVYGLQCTTSAPLDSITNLAKYFITKIKNVQNKGPYRLIGYSFGACVAFEIGVQFEASGETVKILFIDGSPSYPQMPIEKIKTSRAIDNNIVSKQSETLSFFISQFKEVDDLQKITNELSSMESWDARLKKTTKMVSSVSSSSADEISAAAASFYHKLLAADQYKPAMKFKGEVLLVKATDHYVHIEDDYGLHGICQQKVIMETLDGDHRTILLNPVLGKVANNFCGEV